VNACELFDSPLVELYFYDELDRGDRLRVETHLGVCADCRQRLDDLRAIREALAAVPRTDAPPAGDWSGFMRRLDAACGVAAERVRTPRASGFRLRASGVLAMAAMLAVMAIGIYMAARVRGTVTTPATTQTQVADRAPAAAAKAPDRALIEQSQEHFERSKLVVLDLATRDARQTKPDDWEYERELAGTLLPDTRLFRIAAQNRGLEDVAGTLGDLETVLLEASLSDARDPDALARVQRLIRRRDLLVKMQAAHTAGI